MEGAGGMIGEIDGNQHVVESEHGSVLQMATGLLGAFPPHWRLPSRAARHSPSPAQTQPV